jgi:rubrerythrin
MTACELLEIAKVMEKDGAEFYRTAAGIATDPKVKKIMEEFSVWEQSHYVLFDNLLKETPADAVIDNDSEAVKYLEAFAKYAVFSPAGAEKFGIAQMDAKGVLQHAIALEKDAVCYYYGLKNAGLPEKSAKTIEKIVQEEMKHIQLLSEQLSHLRDDG